MCLIAKFKLWEARHTYGVSAMRADFVVYKLTVIQINANRFATSSFVETWYLPASTGQTWRNCLTELAPPETLARWNNRSCFPINVPMVHPTAVSMDLDNFRIAQYC